MNIISADEASELSMQAFEANPRLVALRNDIFTKIKEAANKGDRFLAIALKDHPSENKTLEILLRKFGYTTQLSQDYTVSSSVGLCIYW